MKKVKLTKQLIFSIVFTIGILLSIRYLYFWYSDSNQINDEIEKINSITKTTEDKTDNTNQIVNPPLNEDSPYWKYIKVGLIDVDFEELRKINSETKGWIKVEGTNINYPFVQTKDNTFYLNHTFNKKENNAGWVFLDSRNNIEELDRNNILYAHGRVNSVLFGTLKNIMKSNWYENSNNHIIKLSTQSHNSLWQVFSVYRIPTTSDYLVTDFRNDETFDNFLKFIKQRSIYDFNIELSSKDKIITLSTCYSSKEKVVMHAKLIKIEQK